uniref:Metastriate ixostatin family member n=1 Tax=Rhipicephalus zambeziensis TaxID=60191 RepID=A0A224YV77_9ACAR
MFGIRHALAFFLLISFFCLTKGRLIKKGNVWWTDQDCKRPNCPQPQRLVCPTNDACDCYCKDVPCYVPRCSSGCQATCFTRPGFCQCKCVPANRRCAEAWESECLPVCVGYGPCKCNCVGAFQPHQRNEYRNSSLGREFGCQPPPQIIKYSGKRK